MNYLAIGLKDFKAWLAKPYPCPVNWYQKMIPSLSVPLMIYFILLTFRPFGIADIIRGHNWFIAGYCFITMYVMLSSAFLGPVVFPDFFNAETWTIGRYLVHILFDYLIASSFSWIYTMTAGQGIVGSYSFLLFCWYTFSVSLFPVLLIVFYYERIHFRKKLQKATYYTGRLEMFQQREGRNVTLRLTVDKKSAEKHISSSDFICARANGNYTMVHYYHGGEIRHIMIRLPISVLEKMSAEDQSIVRCHRGALVNLCYASKFSGNARNYSIHIDCIHLRLNISRAIPAQIVDKLRHL